jgi:hypothetical protein
LFHFRNNNAEEMEAKYIRVISSSFYGYSLYLKLLSKDILEDFKEDNKVFIASDKFWSFAKHQAPSVSILILVFGYTCEVFNKDN